MIKEKKTHKEVSCGKNVQTQMFAFLQLSSFKDQYTSKNITDS